MKKLIKIICFVCLGISLFIFIVSCSNMLWWKTSNLKDPQFLVKVRTQSGNPDSHYLLACYYQERGRHNEALEEFKKVLLIDPNYIKAYNGMGVSYDLTGDFTGAIEHYIYAARLDPDLGYVYNNLGYSYLLQGNAVDAIAALNKAISINSKDQRFHNNLALAYAEKGQYALALAEFKLGADEAKAHYNMAQIYFKKALIDDAKRHYATALMLNPSLTVVRTALKAADALTRIFEQEPSKADAKRLITPEQPMISKEEIQKSTTEDRTTTTEVIHPPEIAVLPPIARNDGREVVAYNGKNQIAMESSRIEELVTPNQSTSSKPEKVLEPKQLKYPEELIVQNSKKESITYLKEVGIEISNGNGVNRMAKKVGDYLKEKGLRVTRLTNANNFNYSGTSIFYEKSYDDAANHVAGQLPVFRTKEEAEKFDRPNIKIKILIGKDLVPHQKSFENGKKS